MLLVCTDRLLGGFGEIPKLIDWLLNNAVMFKDGGISGVTWEDGNPHPTHTHHIMCKADHRSLTFESKCESKHTNRLYNTKLYVFFYL